MYVCWSEAYVHLCIYIHTYMSQCKLRTKWSFTTAIGTHVYMHACMHACHRANCGPSGHLRQRLESTSRYKYTHKYIHTYIIYIYINIYIFIYTHTHTYIRTYMSQCKLRTKWSSTTVIGTHKQIYKPWTGRTE
jgi:hypothetical protein